MATAVRMGDFYAGPYGMFGTNREAALEYTQARAELRLRSEGYGYDQFRREGDELVILDGIGRPVAWLNLETVELRKVNDRNFYANDVARLLDGFEG